MLHLLQLIGQFVYGILYAVRWLLAAVLAIGLPIFIYLTFIADEPVFSVENDVVLGKQGARSIDGDPRQYPLLSEKDYPEGLRAHARTRQSPVEIAAFTRLTHYSVSLPDKRRSEDE